MRQATPTLRVLDTTDLDDTTHSAEADRPSASDQERDIVFVRMRIHGEERLVPIPRSRLADLLMM